MNETKKMNVFCFVLFQIKFAEFSKTWKFRSSFSSIIFWKPYPYPNPKPKQTPTLARTQSQMVLISSKTIFVLMINERWKKKKRKINETKKDELFFFVFFWKKMNETWKDELFLCFFFGQRWTKKKMNETSKFLRIRRI